MHEVAALSLSVGVTALCTWGWSFDDALRAMVFTLAAVCTILLCIGCIRYFTVMRKLKFQCSLLGVRPLKPVMKLA